VFIFLETSSAAHNSLLDGSFLAMFLRTCKKDVKKGKELLRG
jgi:hypothetical protein